MNTLRTIQKVFRAARIICQILFICCIVGVCLSMAGAVSLALDAPSLKIGGVSIAGLVEREEGISRQGMVTLCLSGACQVAALGVLAWLGRNYFRREEKDGTPFSRESAVQLRHLGIHSIWVPVVARVVAEVLCLNLPGNTLSTIRTPASWGVMLIILSLVCQYGAEVSEKQASA